MRYAPRMKRAAIATGACLSAALGLYGCVSDPPVVGDGGGADAAVDSPATQDATQPPADGAADAGCMLTAPLSGVINNDCAFAPTTKNNPLPTGTFILTASNTGSFIGCNTGKVAGGLVVTTSGGNITLDRHLQTRGADGGTVKLEERWVGTFDAVKGEATVTRVCPPPAGDSGVGEVWSLGTVFTILGDGGGIPDKVRMRDPNYRLLSDDAGAFVPTLTFTKQ